MNEQVTTTMRLSIRLIHWGGWLFMVLAGIDLVIFAINGFGAPDHDLWHVARHLFYVALLFGFGRYLRHYRIRMG